MFPLHRRRGRSARRRLERAAGRAGRGSPAAESPRPRSRGPTVALAVGREVGRPGRRGRGSGRAPATGSGPSSSRSSRWVARVATEWCRRAIPPEAAIRTPGGGLSNIRSSARLVAPWSAPSAAAVVSSQPSITSRIGSRSRPGPRTAEPAEQLHQPDKECGFDEVQHGVGGRPWPIRAQGPARVDDHQSGPAGAGGRGNPRQRGATTGAWAAEHEDRSGGQRQFLLALSVRVIQQRDAAAPDLGRADPDGQWREPRRAGTGEITRRGRGSGDQSIKVGMGVGVIRRRNRIDECTVREAGRTVAPPGDDRLRRPGR